MSTANTTQIKKLADETAILIDALCERDELIREMVECLQGKGIDRVPRLIADAERLIPKTSVWEDNGNE
jgi:hypothetical protein